MTHRKSFTCDLCNSPITETDGVGIVHSGDGAIRAVWLQNESAGHHLCNPCVKGLRGMLEDLGRAQQIHDELDEPK